MFNLNKPSIEDIKDINKTVLYQNSSSYLTIFSLVFLFNLIVLGFFGIISGIQSIVSKNEVVSELTMIKTNMAMKIGQLEEASKVFDQAQKYTPVLNSAIPDQAAVQDYLVMLTDAFSKNGFVIQRFVPVDTVSGAVEASRNEILIEVQAVGDASNVTNLVSTIEKLPRFTKISLVSATYDPVDPLLDVTRLSLVIYKNL